MPMRDHRLLLLSRPNSKHLDRWRLFKKSLAAGGRRAAKHSAASVRFRRNKLACCNSVAATVRCVQCKKRQSCFRNVSRTTQLEAAKARPWGPRRRAVHESDRGESRRRGDGSEIELAAVATMSSGSRQSRISISRMIAMNRIGRTSGFSRALGRRGETDGPGRARRRAQDIRLFRVFGAFAR